MSEIPFPPLKLAQSHYRSLLPWRLYVDHSHCPVLAPATLAALPSTRAIPDRDVFYVAHPIRSIRRCNPGSEARWIGWKAWPLLRIRCSSEDDDMAISKGAGYQAAKPHLLLPTRPEVAFHLIDEKVRDGEDITIVCKRVAHRSPRRAGFGQAER